MKTIASRRTTVGRFALIALAVTVLARADGVSDPSFGNDGVVKIAFPGTTGGGVQAAAVVGDKILAAGFAPIASISPPKCSTRLVCCDGVPRWRGVFTASHGATSHTKPHQYSR